MARQLAMDKVLTIKHLEQAGYSERRIAEQLGVSRKAVRNHLGRKGSKDTNALTGPNAGSAKAESPQSHSCCAPFHELILSKLEQGLDAMRIYQDLKSDHGFTAKYHSVRRYVATLGRLTELPFQHMEVELCEQMQVDFGRGARCKNYEVDQDIRVSIRAQPLTQRYFRSRQSNDWCT